MIVLVSFYISNDVAFSRLVTNFTFYDSDCLEAWVLRQDLRSTQSMTNTVEELKYPKFAHVQF